MPPVTVITGGSRGIGAATARRLSADGHRVAISYVQASGPAEELAREIAGAGGRCVAVRADTTVQADVDRLFDLAGQELGVVTGLVNNAGITGPLGRLADLSGDTLRRVVEVNVVGYLLCAQRAARQMAASAGGAGGAIVNISSAAATLGSPNEYVHYAATKGAVDSMTVGLAKELAPEGIRVNAVAPGIIQTEIHAAMGDPDRPQRLAGRIPAGRPGEPEEIAAAIAWLLGPDSSFTTGAVVRVAGGL
ncbi:SDR family oxidoreductase [Crossiella sp. CA198]|uniref:SDR family oxidoreductase n=1 Tax=Crossiella sp. CA198 TaxID=3455607 RepID=UPI003F8D4802